MNLKKSFKSFTQKRKNSTSSNYSFDNSKIRISFASISIEGQSHVNEDRCFHVPDLTAVENAPPVSFVDTVGYAGVFDGHGGHQCSDYLSKALHRKIISNPHFQSFSEDAEKVLYETYLECEDEFSEIAAPSGDTSGSCAATALINGLNVTVAHAGDCRVVVRSEKKVTELTMDHRPSVPSEKARIKAAGGVIRGGRVQGVLAPSRSFGDLDVKLSCKDAVIAEPDINSYTVEIGKSGVTYMILATDGVFDAMSSEKAMSIIHKSFTKTKNPKVAVAALADQACSLNSDDVTVILVVWNVEND